MFPGKRSSPKPTKQQLGSKSIPIPITPMFWTLDLFLFSMTILVWLRSAVYSESFYALTQAPTALFIASFVSLKTIHGSSKDRFSTNYIDLTKTNLSYVRSTINHSCAKQHKITVCHVGSLHLRNVSLPPSFLSFSFT